MLFLYFLLFLLLSFINLWHLTLCVICHICVSHNTTPWHVCCYCFNQHYWCYCCCHCCVWCRCFCYFCNHFEKCCQTLQVFTYNANPYESICFIVFAIEQLWYLKIILIRILTPCDLEILYVYIYVNVRVFSALQYNWKKLLDCENKLICLRIDVMLCFYIALGMKHCHNAIV